MDFNSLAKMIISNFILLISTSIFADEPIIGKWLVVESQTGKVRAIIEFKKEADDTISGPNIKLIDQNLNQNSICAKCPEPFKNKPLLGAKNDLGLKKFWKIW